MNKQRTSSDKKRRRGLHVGNSSLHRSMRCEQLENRCLMHGMPWHYQADSDSFDQADSVDSVAGRSAYVSWASTDSATRDRSVAAADANTTQHDCDHGGRRSSMSAIPEGEGNPPPDGVGFTRPSDASMSVGGRDRSGFDRPNTLTKADMNDSGYRTSLALDAKQGLVPDSTNKGPGPASNNPFTPVNAGTSVGSSSGIVVLTPISTPRSATPENVQPVSAGHDGPAPATGPGASSTLVISLPPTLGNVLSLLRGNQTPAAQSAGSSTGFESRSSISTNSLVANSAGNSTINSLSTNSNSGSINSASISANMQTSGWQSALTVDSSSRTQSGQSSLALLAEANSSRTNEPSLGQAGRVRAALDNWETTELNRGSKAGSSSNSSSDDIRTESAGLQRQLKAQLELLAQQRQRERASETNVEASSDDSADLTTQSTRSRQHAKLLASNGLLELSTDRHTNATSVGATLGSTTSDRNLDAHAAAFASIALYREFDLLVDTPDQTTPQNITTPGLRATAPRGPLAVNAFGNSKVNTAVHAAALSTHGTTAGASSTEDSDSEPSLADRSLLPLSFVALGGMLFRRHRQAARRAKQ